MVDAQAVAFLPGAAPEIPVGIRAALRVEGAVRVGEPEIDEFLEQVARVRLAHGVLGDGLKRPPKGFDPDHPHIEDIKRQTYFVMRHETESLATSKNFVGEVEATFKAAAPLMRFVNAALDMEF